MANGIFSLKQQLQGLIQKAWAGPQTTPYVEYLVVSGGGMGGAGSGGGGGAGGLLQGITPVISGSSITVTVGAGASSYAVGASSAFGNISPIGGGSGQTGGNGALAGGSGAGGESSTGYTTGGQGTFGQGNAGGNYFGTSPYYYCAGGGGAGTVGLNSTTSAAGNGGAGIASAISGTVTTYAGGGGGAAYSGSTGGAGGVGGGGAGANGAAGTAGTVNTGGGGGGGGTGSGGTGGSGIVIISYPDIYNAPSAFGGANSPTASTSGSGSINFTGTADQYLRTGVVSSLNMSTGDFTCEFWVYWTNLNALRIWLSTGVTGADMQIGYNATNGLYYSNGTGSSVNLNAGTTSSLPANTWVHCVVVRSGTTLSLFSAGTRLATTSTSQTTSFSDLFIGCYQGNTSLYNPNGYLTNLRITNTAIYNPSLSTLIVPTAPLTAISGTKLLMSSVSGSYLADSSTNSISVTQGNTGVALPTWNQLSPFATGLGYKNRVYTWTGSGSVTF